MRRYIAIVLLVVATLQGAWGQRTTELWHNWRFFIQEAAAIDNLPYINLPHTWNRDALAGQADYLRTTGTYIHRLNILPEWNGRRLFIECDGTSLSADLFVNGRFAGHHTGSSVPFVVEITELAQPGHNNFLWICVNNSAQLDALPAALDANFYGFMRGVRLLVRDQVAIAGGESTPGVKVVQRVVSREKVEAEAQVALNSGVDRSVVAHLAVITPDCDTVATAHARVKLSAGKGATVSLPFAIAKPSLWEGRDNPYLYNIEVRIADGSVVCDSLTLQTGFRTVAYDPSSGMVLLNGRPCPVNGLRVRQDRSGVGPAVNEVQVEEDVRMIVESGANAVRVVGVPHHPLFYDLCDRAGIMVWSDLPLQGGNFFTDRQFVASKRFMDSGREQVREIVDRQWNHPSVVMWGVFSDLNLRGDSPVGYVRELNDMLKSYDPSRLTVASSNQDGEINFITDLIAWDQTLGWREGQPSDISIWLEQLHSNWSALPSAVGYGAGGSTFHQEENPLRPEWNGNWHPEQWQTLLHVEYVARLREARLWGRFVDLFDWGWAAGSALGDGVCDMGLVAFDHRERKDAYYLYRAIWNGSQPTLWLADKRLVQRHRKSQLIRAFTNQPQAELWLNGTSQGAVQIADGVASWTVSLAPGNSTLKVCAGEQTDSMTVVLRRK